MVGGVKSRGRVVGMAPERGKFEWAESWVCRSGLRCLEGCGCAPR